MFGRLPEVGHVRNVKLSYGRGRVPDVESDFGHLAPAGDGPQVAVVAPSHCRNGDRLVPGRVVVSWVRCTCDRVRPGSAGHYSWRCTVCGDVQYGDGHVRDDLLVQPGPPRL